MTGGPVADDNVVVWRLFVHARVVSTGPDDIGQLQSVDVERLAHPGFFIQIPFIGHCRALW
ncbi:hypothetical protein D3C86_1723390 [compost metagenome]